MNSELGSVHCTRRVRFCAGHRVLGHESRCSRLHGHNYVVFFDATSAHLDKLGRVIDFAVLEERLGGWIDENWDHGFILNREDQEALQALQAIENQSIFELDANPTAEHLASYLLHAVAPEVLKGSGVVVTRVVVWETENCSAEARL